MYSSCVLQWKQKNKLQLIYLYNCKLQNANGIFSLYWAPFTQKYSKDCFTLQFKNRLAASYTWCLRKTRVLCTRRIWIPNGRRVTTVSRIATFAAAPSEAAKAGCYFISLFLFEVLYNRLTKNPSQGEQSDSRSCPTSLCRRVSPQSENAPHDATKTNKQKKLPIIEFVACHRMQNLASTEGAAVSAQSTHFLAKFPD